MFEVFKYVDKFFTSLTNYLTYNDIFIIFAGLFLFTVLCVIFSTAKSYEARLIKAIDKFNVYFVDNPQINEDNLVAFNMKMKSKKVPKQLRKSWQQFVLYREQKASYYMSFENCVSNPIKNSSYKRDIRLMSVLAYVFAACSLILNCYYCFESSDVASVLQSVLLTPVLILLVNYLVQIFLNLRHSAIVSDLFQNYQYFEVNIDKATETLPEYVDYEVLFDRNEIKKGIPILYAYLQKRAEEEQRELERARLKNVEHEKFNFDDSGVAASLVLERAMQEAENYIAERKKYNQDTQQINEDITQEDINYREITKEYNRQMQVSKETFANFKAQLEDVSSTIEANYLKKQQQQELDRQRNLERDFDTATERHKKVIEGFQAELDTVDKFIAQSRKNLEDAMKNEFSSYSSKVYDEAKKLVEEREKDKFNKLKQTIKQLEEKLVAKDGELNKVYEQNQLMNEKLESYGVSSESVQPTYDNQTETETQSSYQETETEYNYQEEESQYDYQAGEDQYLDQEQEPQYEYQEEDIQEQPTNNNLDYEAYRQRLYGNQNNEDQNYDYNYDNQDEDQQYSYDENADNGTDDTSLDEETEQDDVFDKNNKYDWDVDYYNDEQDEDDDNSLEDYLSEADFDEIFADDEDEEEGNEGKTIDFSSDLDEETEVAQEEDEEDDDKNGSGGLKISTEQNDDGIKNKVPSKRGRPKKVVDEKPKQGEMKKRGRPRKVEQPVSQVEPKRGRGRPKKVEAPIAQQEVKKGRGRPKKVAEPVITEVKKGRGRPKKVETPKAQSAQTAKGPGRPKKAVQPIAKTEVKKGPGRPKKEIANVEVKKGPGRPKKVQEQPAVKTARRGRPKKVQTSVIQQKKGRGRPKKQDGVPSDIKDIDAYLKEIDNAIAAENAKLKESQKELAKNAKLRRKK